MRSRTSAWGGVSWRPLMRLDLIDEFRLEPFRVAFRAEVLRAIEGPTDLIERPRSPTLAAKLRPWLDGL